MKIALLIQHWKLGWRTIGRLMLAYLIVCIWFLPWLLIGTVFRDFFSSDTALSVGIRLILLSCLLLVYLPIAVFSAASNVGFCSVVSSRTE
jgi:hypothetical protein